MYVVPQSQPPLLSVHDLHAAYAKKSVLRGVTFSVRAGEVVAVFGRNGSGKSTLLKTISGILPSQRGTVYFDGCDVTRATMYERHRMGIGFLMQGGRVFSNLTVAENLAVALRGAGRKIDSSAVTPGFIFSDLFQRRHTPAGLLSGGQRQMIAIEMVLAQRPQLLLLDEPTSALSRDLSARAIQAIAAFARQSGASILVVEQNRADVRDVASRTVVIHEGIACHSVP